MFRTIAQSDPDLIEDGGSDLDDFEDDEEDEDYDDEEDDEGAEADLDA